MKKKFKLIWFGPMVPQKYLKNWRSTSPAAVKWQKHLLNALVKNKVDIEMVYYRAESYWPKGKLFPSNEFLKNDFKYKSKQIKYINFPGFRNLSIRYSVNKILKKICYKNYEFQVIISYNAPSWMEILLRKEKIRSKFKCIYIVADTKIPKGADGYIFLSYYLFNKYKFINKLHLDGAIYPKKESKLKKISFNKTIFLYSGSFGKWAGLKLLLDSINLIKEEKFELWITGRGKDEFIKKASRKDHRIKYLGFLSENQIQKIYSRADVFINTRLPKMPENNFNFPSKLFDYLAWNKPIISTWTKSLSPEYKNLLDIVEDDPLSIARAIQKYTKKKSYFKKNKNLLRKKWYYEGKKLINFLNEVVLKN